MARGEWSSNWRDDTDYVPIDLSNGVIHICQGGRIYRFEFAGRTWYIEMHHWCGPCWLDSNLEPRKNPQPGPRAKFWKAVAHLEAMTPAQRQQCEV